MTVTKRKQKPRDTGGPDTTVAAPALESGMKASCDSCSADITHSVHVRCAETINPHSDRLSCPDFDLCVPCFLSGKSVGPHRSHHAYRIISSHAFPIFTNDWGADEELLLIEGAEMYGLGNWADMAEHVGGRTKEECEKHYMDTYIWSDDYPLPTVAPDFNDDQEAFQKRKKARLEELQSRPVPLPPPKPMASAPTCHEIGGFMPGRLEFETEYENEAEVLIKDLEFGKVYAFGGADQPASLEDVEKEKEVEGQEGTQEVAEEEEEKKIAGEEERKKPENETEKEKEPITEGQEEEGAVEAEGEGAGEEKEKTPPPPPMGQAPGDELQEDLELKLTLLDMFNERYDKRMAAKELIADRGLINYKQIVVNERKRNKEERDLILRAKPFAKIQTALDHEIFVDGLLHELALRKRIAELQEYRRMGVTSIADVERYEHAKAQRSSRSAYRDPLSALARARNGGYAATPTVFKPAISGAPSRPPTSTPPALTLASASSLHLLTVLEQQLCSTLRILPKPYLFLKETLLREWARRGGKMKAKDARDLIVKKPPPPLATTIAPAGEEGATTTTTAPTTVEDVMMQNGAAEATSGEDEWGEKVERVFEFLVDTGRLNAQPHAKGLFEELEAIEGGAGMKSGLRPTTGTFEAVMNGEGPSLQMNGKPITNGTNGTSLAVVPEDEMQGVVQ